MDIPPPSETDQGPISFRIGDLQVDTGRQRVTRDGVALSLPKLSYDLLLVLIRAAPNLVSNEELLDKVWPKAVVSPETLSQRIKLLRDALGDNPRSPTYVEGLRGRGYRLIPAVEQVARAKIAPDPPAPDPTRSAPAPAPVSPAEPVVTPSPANPRRRTALGAGLAFLALITIGAGIYWAGRHAHPSASVDVVAMQPRAVAVLPFENRSDTPGSQYIALGIAESVLNRLGSVRELIVIARSSSFSLGTPRPDARDAAAKLGAQYVVQGSIQRAGNRLRVNAQLVDAVRNQEMWSLSYDRDLDDVFAMQDEIATHVAEKLEVSLSRIRPEYAAFGTEAYLAFLHGRALLETRKRADVEASIGEFSHALQLAPTFAAAMTALASAKMQLASLRADFYKHADTLLPEMRALVDRSIELDPGAGASYYMRAQLCIDEKDCPGVEADFRKGFELAPNDADGVFNYGAYLYEQDRNEEALALLDRASLLDPMAASTHYLRGQILYTSSPRLEDAAASYRQAIVVAPDFYPAYTRLSMVQFFQGKLAEAIQTAEKSIAIESKVPWTRARVVWLYLHLGDVAAARDVQREVDASDSNGRINAALLCHAKGDLEGADRIVRRYATDPDVDTGFGLMIGTEAVFERALSRHQPEAAREFILSLPALRKVDGRVAIVDFNWPFYVTMAVVEQQAGHAAESTKIAQDTLDFVDQGKLQGSPGNDDYTRAVALAVLNRPDEAMQALERMAQRGNHLRWWVTLESDPAFGALRSTPRFQKFAAQTRSWVAAEQAQVRAMRERGDIPSRAATTPVDGC